MLARKILLFFFGGIVSGRTNIERKANLRLSCRARMIFDGNVDRLRLADGRARGSALICGTEGRRIVFADHGAAAVDPVDDHAAPALVPARLETIRAINAKSMT
jgi:hypothetical protein